MGQGRLVLVTGGAGFVGSHTILELLQGGHDVVVVDNCVNAVAGAGDDHALPPALQRVQKITGKTVHFHMISLLDRAALAKVFAKYKVEVVIHFAALKAVGESVEKPLAYYANNVTGTLNLLEVMSEAGVKRIVYSSSATVYGVPQYLPTDENHPTGVGVTNPYGKTKYVCEQIMKDLAVADKAWRVVLLRYFNPVGAHESGQIGEDPNGIPNNLMPFISQVAVGKRDSVRVFGNDYETPDGTGVRDYIHVVDLAVGHAAALKKIFAKDFSGALALNLGTGKGVSVLEMIKAYSKASGREVPYEVVGRRDGDVAKLIASCTLAEQELGWSATRSLHQMYIMKGLILLLAFVAFSSAHECHCGAFITMINMEFEVYRLPPVELDSCEMVQECATMCAQEWDTITNGGHLDSEMGDTGVTVGARFCLSMAEHGFPNIHPHDVYAYYNMCGGPWMFDNKVSYDKLCCNNGAYPNNCDGI